MGRATWAPLLAACLLGLGCAENVVATSSNVAAGTTAAGVQAPAASGSGAGAGSGAAGVAGSAASGKLSFENDIYPRVIRARCANCHNDAPSFGGLAMFPGAMTAYANLVGVPAGSEATYRCRSSGLMRVEPGSPERSLIYLKLTAPPCGSKMPPAAFGTANAEQVELVRQWIADGAAP